MRHEKVKMHKNHNIGFWCAGCRLHHHVPTSTKRWRWNRDKFVPTVNFWRGDDDKDFYTIYGRGPTKHRRCIFRIHKGTITYHEGSWHFLAGKKKIMSRVSLEKDSDASED